jgi:hypothetical protein
MHYKSKTSLAPRDKDMSAAAGQVEAVPGRHHAPLA